MPISEDEYDSRIGYEPSSTMSKAELRKTHKPIMEKRRRARINHCLNEIKTLLLEAMKKDPARHSKLEKADILEMAVKHLQSVQRQHLALSMATDPSVMRKFKSGFNECAEEINRYVNQLDGIGSNVQHRISSHLTKCITGIEQVVQLNLTGFGSFPFLGGATNFLTQPSTETPSKNLDTAFPGGDQNNNPKIQIHHQGLQLIPSRLPTGEFALLLPNSSNLSYFSSLISPQHSAQSSQASENETKQQRPSAFVTVIPSSISAPQPESTMQPPQPLSPPQSPTSTNIINEEVIIPKMATIASPRGFRPVHRSQPIHRSAFTSRVSIPQHQTVLEPHVHHPTPSTSIGSSDKMEEKMPNLPQIEVKTIKFPIHAPAEKKFTSPQKFGEPLSIITNHAERYKQAQMREDTAFYEENMQGGVKRKADFGQGLLTVAPNEAAFHRSKIIKLCHETDGRIVRKLQSDGGKSFASSSESLGPFGGHARSYAVNLDGVRGADNVPYDFSAAAKEASGSRQDLPSSSSGSVDTNNLESHSADMWRPW